MVTELKAMRDSLNQAKGKRNLLYSQLTQAKENRTAYETLYENCLKARTVVTAVAKSTQEQLEFHISNLVSMALSSVFPDPYLFSLRFVERRNKTECDLIFSKNNNSTDDILNSGGGGVADVASLALRIALWSIKKTRPTFLLDEPTKFLHNISYQEKASTMLKEISSKLGVQIIMVSDQAHIIQSADKVIEIKNEKGVATTNDY